MYSNETSLLSRFAYIALAKTLWEIKLGEFKSDQNFCQVNQEILKSSKNNHNIL